MEDTLLVRDQTILDMQAWRGVFQERADAGDGEAIVIKEPRDVTAVLTPVDAKELVGSTNRLGPDAFEIVWMPSPAGDLPNAEYEVEAWSNRATTPRRRSIVRAGTRTARVFWCEGRGLIYCKAAQLRDTLDGVVRFALTERETVALERGMKSAWAAIEEDKSLTHAVTAGQQTAKARRYDHRAACSDEVRSNEGRDRPRAARPDARRAFQAALRRVGDGGGVVRSAPRLSEPVQFASDYYNWPTPALLKGTRRRSGRTS